MGEPLPEPSVRLRQAVLVTGELEPAAAELRSALGLGEPFRDPGVGEFGLANAVFALGDCFLEIVSPIQEGTAAGRFLERAGEGGYMVIFDVLDLEGARARAAARGVRVVWQLDLPDISGTHLHPRDIGGAIVSVDRSNPYGSWRWGGPQWTGKTGTGAPGRLAGITVAVRDPDATAALWGEVLGAPEDGGVLALDGTSARFHRVPEPAPERISELELELPDGLPGGAESIELLGVRLRALDGSGS